MWWYCGGVENIENHPEDPAGLRTYAALPPVVVCPEAGGKHLRYAVRLDNCLRLASEPHWK